MIGMKLQTTKFGGITVLKEIARGGEGGVFATNNQSVLLKVYDPRDTDVDVPRMREVKRSAYRTFANLRLDNHQELSCLPLEYVALPSGEPAYVMRLAEGKTLESVKHSGRNSAPLLDRLQMAYALATALQGLHSAQIVHADMKWENYVITRIAAGYRVYVLDIDAGGYRGPVVPGRYERLLPTAVPDGIFRSPELIQSATWPGLWNTAWAFQPDLWALAVMLYCIIVDADGPFPLRPTRDLGSGLPAYTPYQRRDIISTVSWPKDWQAALMHQQNIPQPLIDAFVSTFSGERDVTKSSRPRLSAADWKTRLQRTIPTTKQIDVSAVSRLAPPSGATTQRGPIPVQVHSAANALPPSARKNAPATPVSIVVISAPVKPNPGISSAPAANCVKSRPPIWQSVALGVVLVALWMYFYWQAVGANLPLLGAGEVQATIGVIDETGAAADPVHLDSSSQTKPRAIFPM